MLGKTQECAHRGLRGWNFFFLLLGNSHKCVLAHAYGGRPMWSRWNDGCLRVSVNKSPSLRCTSPFFFFSRRKRVQAEAFRRCLAFTRERFQIDDKSFAVSGCSPRLRPRTGTLLCTDYNHFLPISFGFCRHATPTAFCKGLVSLQPHGPAHA